jgi:hypothetical protein
MNEQTKSLIRHILTALGFVLSAVGVADAANVIDFLLADLDILWDAVLVLIGAVTTIIGFFRNSERFKEAKKSE